MRHQRGAEKEIASALPVRHSDKKPHNVPYFQKLNAPPQTSPRHNNGTHPHNLRLSGGMANANLPNGDFRCKFKYVS